MAKKSNKNNYPKLRWVVMLAIAISIPVTIWTFNTAPTETRSNAATYNTCAQNGGACYKYNCPKDREPIPGTCSISDSTCCRPVFNLSAPTGLRFVSFHCSKTPNFSTITIKWNLVNHATSYDWYYSVNGSSYRGPYNYKTNQAIIYPQKGDRTYTWYVKAKNQFTIGPASIKVVQTQMCSL